MSDSLSGTQITPTITFNQVPANLVVPGDYIEIDTDYSNIGLLPVPARGLVIGQGRAAGIGTLGKIYSITAKGQAESLFGFATPVTDMVNAWLAANPGIPLDAVNVGPGTGSVVAAGGIAFSAAATIAGSQAIGVAGNRIAFTIEPTDTPAEMATNFMDAAYALMPAGQWPVAFAVVEGTPGEVAITAICAGAIGNCYDIRVDPALGDYTVPGVDIAITAMTGGEGVPEITAVLAAIATTWYTDAVTCFTDTAQTLAALQPALIERAGPINPLDTYVTIAWTGTQGQLAGLMSQDVNCEYLVALGVQNPQQPPWVWAASLSAVAAAALLDDPARQLKTLVLPGVIAPAPADRIMYEEQAALLTDGIATFDVAPDGSVILQRVVTTYTESADGAPDTSWQDVMTPRVMTRIRYDWTQYLKLVYPRNKLADDGSVAAEYDPSVATPTRLKNAWAARSMLYEKQGWIENSAETAQQAIFVRDANNRNQVNAQMPVQVLGNLMINAQQLVFDAGV